MAKKKKKFVLKYKEVAPGEYKTDHKCPPHIWSQDKTSEMGEWDCIFGDKSSYTAPDCDHCGVLEKEVVREYPEDYDKKRAIIRYISNLTDALVQRLAKLCTKRGEVDSLVISFLKEEFPKEFDPNKHIFRVEYVQKFVDRDGHIFFRESDYRRFEVDTNEYVRDLMYKCSGHMKGCSFLEKFLKYKLK